MEKPLSSVRGLSDVEVIGPSLICMGECAASPSSHLCSILFCIGGKLMKMQSQNM